MSDVFKERKPVRIYNPRDNINGNISIYFAREGKKKTPRGITIPQCVIDKVPWVAGDRVICEVYEDLCAFVLRMPNDNEVGDFELYCHGKKAMRINSTSFADALITYCKNWGFDDVTMFSHWILEAGVAFKPIGKNKR